MEQPHDHLGAVIGPYLPKHALFRSMMEKSFEILDQHPVNLRRAAQGKNKANSLWFWGAGTKPSLQSFREKTGLSGTMISAVDLLPDYPTPIRCGTHTSDPVPYVLYDSTRQFMRIARFCEKEAAAAGNYEDSGYRLMDRPIACKEKCEV